ncbi:MAG: V4R domain-containing protein [Nitrososphaerales archaeon]|jgi:predicted hydrocarbon binding protein
MLSRDKGVMIFHYDPKKKIYLVSLHLKNQPGALGNLTNLLAVRGMNILEGYFGGMSYEPKATVSFFVESTNPRMDEGWVKDFVESSTYASDVEVRSGVDGFVSDSVNFPLSWNAGDRAILMQTASLRTMLAAIIATDREKGERLIYDQGFSLGRTTYERLFLIYRPKNRAGLAEVLRTYAATGWGRLELSGLDPGHKRAKFKLEEGFECAGLNTGKPESNFIRGHLSGVLSAYFGSDVKAVETRCVSKGDPHCEFEISP